MRLIFFSVRELKILSFVFIVSTLLELFSGCSSSTDTATNTTNATSSVQTNFPAGKIIRTVSCEADFDFSYSLFLPENYQTNQTYPLIIFFDPHAAGDLPLRHYSSLANKFGYILAGSNDSKNGMNPAMYQKIYRTMRNHLTKKFNVNTQRIYLAGFSGGGRVASGIALADNTIAGVISNSAGFEPSTYTPPEGFVFIGIAGNEDFNLLEQRRTEKNLEPYSGVFHQLIEFNGKHEWAPADEMENTFLFLECSAKKNNIATQRDSLLVKKYNALKTQLNSTKTKAQRFQLLKKMHAYYLAGIAAPEIEDELKTLMNNSAIQRMQRDEELADANETVQQANLYKKMFTENISWWNSTVEEWNKSTKIDAEKQLNKRLQSYISLTVYMTIVSPQAQNEIVLLEKLIAIYELVDPENPEWAYQKAVLRSRQGNKNEALLLLNRCAELKFTDKDRIASQPEFSSLLHEPDFPSSLR